VPAAGDEQIFSVGMNRRPAALIFLPELDLPMRATAPRLGSGVAVRRSRAAFRLRGQVRESG